MALALATFRTRFPEFGTSIKPAIEDATVQACIDEAEATVDRAVMDASTTYPKGDAVVGYRAAAALRRMLGDEHAEGPASAYDDAANRLARAAAAAYRMI